MNGLPATVDPKVVAFLDDVHRATRERDELAERCRALETEMLDKTRRLEAELSVSEARVGQMKQQVDALAVRNDRLTRANEAMLTQVHGITEACRAVVESARRTRMLLQNPSQVSEQDLREVDDGVAQLAAKFAPMVPETSQ